MLQEPIKVVGRFEGGGLGELLKCKDAKGFSFAAKFPKDQSATSQRFIVDEERRFHRHQGAHVVQYYGTIQHTDGRRGFAMELMEGSLSGLIETGGAIRRGRAIAYLADAIAGLAEVHESGGGAYHGDIKPANILYKNGVAKLADFGLARGGAGQTQMVGPHNGGTPGYFPPEGKTSPQGDVYSLGVTLWAMIAGRNPPATGPDATLELPPILADILSAMLARDPSIRPTTRQLLENVDAMRRESPDWLKALGVVAAGVGIVAVLLVGLPALIGAMVKKR
jgi:serine/threonine protein kinase